MLLVGASNPCVILRWAPKGKASVCIFLLWMGNQTPTSRCGRVQAPFIVLCFVGEHVLWSWLPPNSPETLENFKVTQKSEKRLSWVSLKVTQKVTQKSLKMSPSWEFRPRKKIFRSPPPHRHAPAPSPPHLSSYRNPPPSLYFQLKLTPLATSSDTSSLSPAPQQKK